MWNYFERNRSKSRPSIQVSISIKHLQELWHKAQQQSNTLARYNAYLNHLSVSTILPWLADYMAEEESGDRASVWRPEKELSSILEFVNGTAIQLGERRLVLIPVDEIESEQLIVEQEWIDIASWIGDYYLPIGIHLDGDDDDCWLRLWGFATHSQIKHEGNYDANSRTYSLDFGELIQDFTVMQMTLDVQPLETVEPLSALSEEEAQQFIQIFSNSDIYSPRLHCLPLNVSFEKWAALVENDQWRQNLYERRTGNVMLEDVAATATATSHKKQPVNLRQWLHNLAEESQKKLADGWQEIEALFAQSELSPVRGNGGTASAIADSENSLSAIASTIRLLDSSKTNLRSHAALVLGEIGQGNAQVIQALTRLLQTDPDKTIRQQAALSLGKVDPGNSAAAIQKAKLINLGMQLQQHQVALMVAIMPQINDRLQVFVEVQSQKPNKLPADLTLSILSESGQVIRDLEVKSQGIRDSIHLKSFTPPPGTYFRVRVSLHEISIIEDFMV